MPIEDSDQPAHSRRLIRTFTLPFWIVKDAKFLYADNKESDRNAQMH